ncbi:hypothetical protein LCGC14_0919340 [marine sediment metagenome]|uniref:Uncharacterized protein n=1 Tax=marine sediment metagenome TaxID=412755 RepID=A0A0F9RXW3_9ZZZZ
MSTNFPASLDDNLTLGALFTNVVAVTDPVTQIDATYRVNIKDAVLATEARLGITNSTIPTSLSWATLSAGGTDNLGLRFAGSSATWPGLVAEDGIFLDVNTGFCAFHRQGENVNTFYQLATTSSVWSLQGSYDGGNTILTSGAADLALTIAAGDDFTITQGVGTATVLSGAATTLTTGLLDINCTAIAATNAVAVHTQTTNAVNNQEFGSYVADSDNLGDLAAGEIFYGYAADLSMGGDGPVAPARALGAAFYARIASFAGANAYESCGLLADNSWDWGMLSASTVKIEMPGTTEALVIDSDPAAFISAVMVANVATDARSMFINCVEGTLDTPVAARFWVHSNGETHIVADTTNAGLSVTQDGAGQLLLVRSTGPTIRFSVGNDGNTAIVVDNGYAAAAVTITHGAATEPFIKMNGTYAALKANGNVTDNDTGGAVVGPGTNVWTFNGMMKVEVGTGGGGVTAGDYWVALYS